MKHGPVYTTGERQGNQISERALAASEWHLEASAALALAVLLGKAGQGAPGSQSRHRLTHRRTSVRYTVSTRYVYTRCMSRVRTNIEIEDTYLQAIMDRYGVRTKTEAVDLALRHLAGQPMTREDALAMRGAHAIGKVPADSKPPPS